MDWDRCAEEEDLQNVLRRTLPPLTDGNPSWLAWLEHKVLTCPCLYSKPPAPPTMLQTSLSNLQSKNTVNCRNWNTTQKIFNTVTFYRPYKPIILFYYNEPVTLFKTGFQTPDNLQLLSLLKLFLFSEISIAFLNSYEFSLWSPFLQVSCNASWLCSAISYFSVSSFFMCLMYSCTLVSTSLRVSLMYTGACRRQGIGAVLLTLLIGAGKDLCSVQSRLWRASS